ncbi:glycoprotein [Dakrong virus]|uniref:Envelopment polyprotein n=1 Tax=Dakrong virus TaxID=2304450 RepID=A0A455KZW2_9VIRU|nr:glycoprotein [Dakrong virus]
MKIIILSILLGYIEAKPATEINFQCPHGPRQDTGFSHASLEMMAEPIEQLMLKTIESSCPFELHQTKRSIQSVTTVTWAKKTETGDTANAAATTYEVKQAERNLIGICLFTQGITNQLMYGRKGLVCVELSCNQSACLPTVHILIPQQVCINVRNCLITWGEKKINLHFERTFCPNGIIVSGECFQPFYGVHAQFQTMAIMQLMTTCFLISDVREQVKLLAFLENIGSASSCTDNSFYAIYLCFLSGYSLFIEVPETGNQLSMEIATQMALFPYGEDHDKPEHGDGTFRIAGPLSAKLPSTGTETIDGIAYSGQILYTSLFTYPKKVSGKYPSILTEGYIPKVNYSSCDKKVLPLVWKGLVHISGSIENLEPCKIFCTLAGPGATCEAFSPTGIFNISSPTCLIGKLHKFKELEDHMTFSCQRIDTDIIIFCNGQRKVIKTKTLVVGQCIYSITSFLSLIPSIAHSLAVEICIQGFHGWATICLLITFCFGWVLIPSVTWLVIHIIKGIMIITNRHTGESRIKFILERLKNEFHNTVGHTTCVVCTRECSCTEELKAHNEHCIQGSCPYCMRDLHPSQHVLTEHYKTCPLTDRYLTKVKKALTVPPSTTLCYRKLGTFRYKNRCYILIVWLTLLFIETLMWAASAEIQQINTQWQDTAHGVGIIPMQLDYEMDFALISGSSYAHKRILTHPTDEDKRVPFTVHLSSQQIVASVQFLGHWMDGEVNIKSVFHCYGECKKYSYPWQFAHCQSEVDFQFETGWGCNPVDCPGVGTGCTACGLFIDKLTPKATVYKIVNLQFYRTVSYQIGSEQMEKDVDTNDCLSGPHVKVCMMGTMSNLQIGDTLVFFGPISGGAVLVRQWCTTNCKLGDPGDIMTLNAELHCPDFLGTMEKRCQFATEPLCLYQGNTVSGYKRMHQTVDAFVSLNMSDPKLVGLNLMWSDPDGIYKDHVNIVVNKDISFEELAENPCQVDLTVSSIEGSWGSGIGFSLTCSVSLTECSSFLTTVKACDRAMCYGGKAVSLVRGQNTVVIQGRGGHSGSGFKCCHDTTCSKNYKKASAPHLERVTGENTKISDAFSDGAPECGILCKIEKVGEWLTGLFHGNWWVVVVLVGVMILSLLLLSFVCPARRK